jgi:RNA polymerase sigma-B factor
MPVVHATHLRTSRTGETDLVEVQGGLDIATTPRLRTVLLGSLAGGARRLVVDLSRADMIDCTAIGVFFYVRDHAEQRGGTLHAVEARGIVLRVLEVTGVAKSLGAYDTVQQTLTGAEGDGTQTGEVTEHAAQVLLRVMGQLPRDAPERTELRAEAIELSLPFATNLARRFRGRGEPQDDLDQVATVGLVKAVDGYDPSLGTEFASYAVPTILGEVRRHFRDRGWRIRVPRRLQELRLNIQRSLGDLTQQLGRTPTTGDLARHLGVAEEEVLAAQEAAGAYRPGSLSEPTHPDSDTVVGDRLATDDRDLDAVVNRESLRPALAKLPRREQRILAMRFFGNMTQTQIAQEIGVSQMHVSRLLASSLRQLRKALVDDSLPA